MPRLAPPPGWTTAKEAREHLGNVSSAMLAYYVNSGQLNRLVPKGRKNGFYNKREVYDLAVSLWLIKPEETPFETFFGNNGDKA